MMKIERAAVGDDTVVYVRGRQARDAQHLHGRPSGETTPTPHAAVSLSTGSSDHPYATVACSRLPPTHVWPRGGAGLDIVRSACGRGRADDAWHDGAACTCRAGTRIPLVCRDPSSSPPPGGLMRLLELKKGTVHGVFMRRPQSAHGGGGGRERAIRVGRERRAAGARAGGLQGAAAHAAERKGRAAAAADGGARGAAAAVRGWRRRGCGVRGDGWDGACVRACVCVCMCV